MIIHKLHIPDDLWDGTNMGYEIVTAIANKVKVPFCLLTRPLVFGDSEQIKALREIEEDAQNVIEDVIDKYSDDDYYQERC